MAEKKHSPESVNGVVANILILQALRRGLSPELVADLWQWTGYLEEGQDHHDQASSLVQPILERTKKHKIN